MEVDLLPFGEQFVQFHLAADASEGGLGKLGCRIEVILDIHHRMVCVQNAEIDDRVHLDRYVVPGDDVL